MRRPYLPVVALTLAAAAACGSSGKGTVAAPPASGSASASTSTSTSAPASTSTSESASAAPGSAASTPNGEAAKPAATVLADAKAALSSAPAVRITGGGSADGTRIAFDLHFAGSAGGEGTLTLQGTTLQLVRSGTQVFVKGDDAFYKQFAGAGSKGAAVAQLLHGKWLKATTANKDFSDVAAFTDIKAFAQEQLKPTGTLTTAAPGSVRGTPTVTLQDGDKGTLSVAATGPPYPLRLASLGGSSSDGGTFDFLEYGVPVALTVPPAAETVDIDALSGLGSSAHPSAAG